jgi:Putative MetA-pathway of phenol degradation
MKSFINNWFLVASFSLIAEAMLLANLAFAQTGVTLETLRCQNRPTLFQWSNGNSFTGGPPLDGDLATDRPDFTEASSTVGRRVLQIESGYTYTFNNDGAGQSIAHSYPETLFRYGILTDWLELRVGSNFFNLSNPGFSGSGAEDLYLGFKIGLTPQEGILPEMALVPQMTVPTGADAVSANRVLPGFNWLYGWEISDLLSLYASSQYNQSVDGGTSEIYAEWAQSATINYSLTEKFGGFTEWFAFFPTSADTEKSQYYFDGGIFYRFTQDVQWDIRSGVGLNDAADDYFVGTGLSLRFR